MPLLAPVRKSVAEPENNFFMKRIIFSYFSWIVVTVERLMIPLNIRHHTFHVHRAVKTVKCNEIRAYVCRAHGR